MRRILAIAVFLTLGGTARAADDPRTVPLPVPLTRLEVKQYLENLKSRKPRIPLPPLSEEDKKQLGERADNYEARLRRAFLPPGEKRGGGFPRQADPNMTLDYAFKVQLFWIVARTTNCHY
jgi:hypothetical protein